MLAVAAQGQRLDPKDSRKRKRRIKMWKQISASRDLVAQRSPESIRVNCNQQKIALTGEMLRGRLIDLFSRREMEVPIKNVDGRALEKTGLLGTPPEISGTDFVDDVHEDAEYRGIPYVATLR